MRVHMREREREEKKIRKIEREGWREREKRERAALTACVSRGNRLMYRESIISGLQHTNISGKSPELRHFRGEFIALAIQSPVFGMNPVCKHTAWFSVHLYITRIA